MKTMRLWLVAGGLMALTSTHLTAQPGGGGGLDPAALQQMAAQFQQRLQQVDPAQLQDFAARFNLDPAQVQQGLGQLQQRIQDFTQADPSQVQQMIGQWQQGIQQGFGGGQFQQGRLATLREQMGITNDAEWDIVNERIQKVLDAQRAVQGDSAGGGLRSLTVGNNSLSDLVNRVQGARAQGGGRQASGGTVAGGPEFGAIQRAVDGKAPTEQTREAIDKLLEARKTHRSTLEEAQVNLREVLTVRQEAVATVNGLL